MVECSMESFMHRDYEVNLFAFSYRLFHEDLSPIYGAFQTSETVTKFITLVKTYLVPNYSSQLLT